MLDKPYTIIPTKIFSDEKLPPNAREKEMFVPNIIHHARCLEKKIKNSNALFIKQGQLLANYEDDYNFTGNPVRYYSTYQSFTNTELRGYFSWRTKFRKGEAPAAPASFIFLHIFELLNLIGVKDPLEAHEKLWEIKNLYAPQYSYIDYYLNSWIKDFIIYYNLPPALLKGLINLSSYPLAGALDNIREIDTESLMEAIKNQSHWCSRSRFYNAYPDDMARVLHNVLKGMATHYGKSCKKGLAEQFFGELFTEGAYLFYNAVFCNPIKRKNYVYSLENQYTYTYKSGNWSVTRRQISTKATRKFQALIKTIDGIMRDEYGFGHPVQKEIKTQWIIKLIKAEIAALQAEKLAQEKKEIKIDFTRLDKIRLDAAETCEKLASVEEELPQESTNSEQKTVAINPEESSDANLLNAEEYRLLHDLLYEKDTNWLKEAGLLPTVLVDGINEKLYERFEDSVVEDTLTLVEDYIDELKELIPL